MMSNNFPTFITVAFEDRLDQCEYIRRAPAEERVDALHQRILELESWIPKAYKEGYQDAQNDESEGFDDDWMVSMAKMIFDEKLEPPR